MIFGILKNIIFDNIIQIDATKSAEIRKLFFSKQKEDFTIPADEGEVTDESDDETEKRRQLFKDEPPIVSLNHLQIRSLISQNYMAQNGVTPSMANSRMGAWLQRVTSSYYKTRLPEESPTCLYRSFLEGFYKDDPAHHFKSYCTEALFDAGPTEKWTKIGAFHAAWGQDITDALVIEDLRAYVSKVFK